MGKEQSLQSVVLGKLNIHIQKVKLDSCLMSYTKFTSKWIKDPNLRAESIKTFQTIKQNTEENVYP